MKIEAGKTYIDRGGREHGPILKWGATERYFHVRGSWMWKHDGTNLLSEDGRPANQQNDLVREVHVIAGIKLEVGQYYLTSDGSVFGPMQVHEHETHKDQMIQKQGDGFVWCALTGRNKATPDSSDYPTGKRKYDLVRESISLTVAPLPATGDGWLAAELNCDEPLDLPLDADKPDFLLPSSVELSSCKRCLTDTIKELDLSEAFLWEGTPQGGDYWGALHAQLVKGEITKLPFKARQYIKKIVAALEPAAPPPKRHRDGAMLLWFTGLTQTQREIIVKAESRTPVGTCPFSSEYNYKAVKAILANKDEKPGALMSAFPFYHTEQGYEYWELVSQAPYLRKLAEVILRHWVEAWERGDRPLAPKSEPAPPMTASAGIEEDDI
jgi:hypothetical protein